MDAGVSRLKEGGGTKYPIIIWAHRHGILPNNFEIHTPKYLYNPFAEKAADKNYIYHFVQRAGRCPFRPE